MKTKRNLFETCLLGALLLPALASEAQPVITSQPTNQLAILGGNATFSVMVTGVGPFTYQWQLNGTNLPNDLTTIVAGNGAATYAGDGGPATNASLNWPTCICLDSANNLLIADTWNNRVRTVDTNGIITTLAGTGVAGMSGGGGAATNAALYWPDGITPDGAGNLYIADAKNNRVRKIDTNGIITTVAGSGLPGFGDDGYPATNSHSRLVSPAGITLGAQGGLYIWDMDSNRVRKVDTNGILTTVAGSLSPSLFGEGGPATNAVLSGPNCVDFDKLVQCNT
jgi:sugar lactone lactonase YvrE